MAQKARTDVIIQALQVGREWQFLDSLSMDTAWLLELKRRPEMNMVGASSRVNRTHSFMGNKKV